jgi:hypothetical protein
MRLERAISDDALRASALPSSALLCIRSLRDPLPGTLRLDGVTAEVWQVAARTALEHEARSAALPIRGQVPAGASAVVFRDEAEILACLARDWTQGTLNAHWWWGRLLRPFAATKRAAPVAWSLDPRHVPAAARLLADQGELIAFATAIDDAEATVLVHSVAHAFAVDLAPAASVRRTAPAGVAGESSARRLESPSEESPGKPRSHSARTWARWAAEAAAADLRAPARALIVLTLMLARAPSVVRRADVVEQIRRWIEGVEPPRMSPARRAAEAEPAGAPSEGADAAPVEDSLSSRHGDAVDRGHETRGDPTTAPVRPREVTPKLMGAREVTPKPMGPRDESSFIENRRPTAALRELARDPPLQEAMFAPPGEAAREAFFVREEPGETPFDDGRSPAPEPTAGSGAPRPPPLASGPARDDAFAARFADPAVTAPDARFALRSPPMVEPTSLPPSQPSARGTAGLAPVRERPASPAHGAAGEEYDLGSWITTEYGGVFFLVNALLALEVYADFTQPRTHTIDVSPWRLLADLARILLGADALDPHDALWPALAELAGPSEGDDGWPDAWRLDARWLEPFPEREGWTWSRIAGRLRIDHPAGFPVVDVPSEADAEAQLARELAPYAARASQAVGVVALGTGWFEALASFLRARVHRAIGAADAEASARLVLKFRARARLTDTRVDVHMSLADLPIEVRLAGLDRDPGWVPAAGRALAFHFD